MKELYRKYRPKKFVDIYGQDKAIAALKKKCRTDSIPHAILFHGPSGTGKTTLGRIIARRLKCGKYDYSETNTADYRGIESIRSIRKSIPQAPIHGNCQVILMDECHKLTSDAQNALLKLLEEPPDHVYFILCTTEPEKLLRTIRSRCMEIRLQAIEHDDLVSLMHNICKKERIKIPEQISGTVLSKIAECANGSAREAIQILDSVQNLDSTAEMLEAIEKVTLKAQVISIARKLLDTKTKWKDIAPILKDLENEDAEQIRWMVLGYAKSVLLKSDNPRAFRMIESFRDNFYDNKFAGVVSACYELINN